MPDSYYRVSLGAGGAATVLNPDETDLKSVEVRQRLRAPSTALLRLAAIKDENGVWQAAEDDRLRCGESVKITFGLYPDKEACVFNGFITEVRLGVTPSEAEAFFEVTCMDGLWLMDRHQRVERFVDKTLAQIIEERISDYGFAPDVEVPDFTSEDDRETLTQRGTDLEFLRSIARRLGLVMYMDSDADGNASLHMHPPRLDEPELPELAVMMGARTNLREAEVSERAPMASRVVAPEVSAIDKGWNENVSEPGEVELGGTDSPEEECMDRIRSLVPAEVLDGDSIHSRGGALAELIGQGRAEWLRFVVEARGTVDTELYTDVLTANRTVPVVGFNDRWSGTYLLTEVQHTMSVADEKAPAYTVAFKGVRNGLGVDSGFPGSGSLF